MRLRVGVDYPSDRDDGCKVLVSSGTQPTLTSKPSCKCFSRSRLLTACDKDTICVTFQLFLDNARSLAPTLPKSAWLDAAGVGGGMPCVSWSQDSPECCVLVVFTHTDVANPRPCVVTCVVALTWWSLVKFPTYPNSMVLLQVYFKDLGISLYFLFIYCFNTCG